MEELFFELKQKVYEKLDINLDVSDEDLYKVIDVCIYEISQHRAISVHNRELLRQQLYNSCLLYTSPSPRDIRRSRNPSSA